ncbi:MAG: isoaspartyl peptidase/L-asparaginase, partial [Candidatus Korarchaeum sp.]|nr:isoaspartyl peptidase/L-asparaginase [Candidatus Korarchaeum sp.]MDW8036120.1 isoaspartyl peptidase/L-asparaginase [Candidatus Korarchaeum sp.]
MEPVIIVHGGAWAIPDEEVDAHLNGVRRAAELGWRILRERDNSIDAVERVVMLMEDDPTFDAGIGSFLNMEGSVDLDASIMEGSQLKAGAVASVNKVKNPIRLARLIMERTEHVLFVGEGAHRLALSFGLELIDPSELIVERERRRWEEFRAKGLTPKRAFDKDSTVGAVAVDSKRRFAAALSTGGSPYRMVGRVGDVPIIGAGLYADDTKGAAACSGHGESIMRVVLAKSTVDMLALGLSAMEAARASVSLLERVGG